MCSLYTFAAVKQLKLHDSSKLLLEDDVIIQSQDMATHATMP